MSTLLAPPSPPAAPVSRAPLILRTRHQWLRWRGFLFVGIAGLSATLVALVVAPKVITPMPAPLAMEIWAAGFGLTGLLAMLAWILAPASMLRTAQRLDAQLAAKNRLEAAIALENSSSPFAEAHRHEIEQYLEQTRDARPARLLPWLGGLLIALLVAHLLLVAVYVVPALMRPPPKKAAVTPPLPKTVPTAAIAWVSPEAEAKSNPVEEVPTVATERSSSGLTGITLEISVNGTPKKSIAIPAQPFDEPGKHTIKSSLYMDDLDVQPFDIVSYYLRGQRIFSRKLPDVTSPIQFVQVRPFRDDALQAGGHANKGYDLLIRLKLAQLRSVKENFVLAHTDLAIDNPVRKEENDRVGKNQADLAGKVDEIIQFFMTEGYPAAMVDLLQKAKPNMAEAGKDILAMQNAAALPPQQRALNDIIEVEKFFHKAIGPVSGSGSENPNDPFHDKQKHELTKRLQAPSGQLETLVKNQQHLAQDVNANPAAGSAPANSGQPTPSTGKSASAGDNDATPAPGDKPDPNTPAPQAGDPFGPDAEKGSLVDRQTRVLQGIGVLQNGNKVFPAAVTNALEAAQKDATDSLRSLRANDTAGARQPAAAAASDLQQALSAMNASGDQQTRQALADAQQKLNDLAGQLRAAAQGNASDTSTKLMDIAKGVNQVRQDLEAAADQQQQAGSAAGAEQLNQLAQKIQQQHFAQELAAMSKNGLDQGRASAIATMLEDLAGQAAHGLASQQQVSAQDYAALVNEFERTRANLAYLAEKAGGVAPGTLAPTSPGIQPGDQAGQKGAGQQPGQQGQGTNPGQQTPAKGPGQSPGQQGQGQQGQGQQGQGQQGQGQQGQGQQGQGQGASGAQTAQNSSPSAGSPDRGSSSGQSPSTAQGKSSGGESPGSGNGNGNGDGFSGGGGAQTAQHDGSPTPGIGPNPVTPGTPQNPANLAPPPAATLEAYREAIENLKNQAQQTANIAPSATLDQLRKTIIRYDKDTSFRQVTPVDIVRFYVDIQKPLDRLIVELQQLQVHAQRSEIVKTPDLNETPAAYRPAVSDYFEALSRDYQPAAPESDAKPGATPQDNSSTDAPAPPSADNAPENTPPSHP